MNQKRIDWSKVPAESPLQRAERNVLLLKLEVELAKLEEHRQALLCDQGELAIKALTGKREVLEALKQQPWAA